MEPLWDIQQRKIKVGFICPCVGIGGADMFMLGLMRYAPNLEFTGVAIGDHTSMWQLQFARNLCPNIPFWQLDHDGYRLPTVNYDKQFANCVYQATKDADIIVSWCMPKLKEHLWTIKKPVIELAQNSDDYAKEIAKGNESVVDFRVAVSRQAATIFPEKYDVQVIWNGVEPTRCAPRFGREQTRKMWGLAEDDRVILYMGRFVDEKFPQAAIMALTQLPDNYKAIFVGKGYLDLQLVDEAQRYVDAGRVMFMEPQFHVGDILAASDVMLLATDFEGMPLAVLEAWMAGLPVVTTTIEPMQELVKVSGVNLAKYVPVRPTIPQLCEAIVAAQAIENQETVMNARMFVWEYMNLARISMIWEEYFNHCLYEWHKDRNRPKIHKTVPREPKLTAKAHVRYIEHG